MEEQAFSFFFSSFFLSFSLCAVLFVQPLSLATEVARIIELDLLFSDPLLQYIGLYCIYYHLQ